MPGFWLILFALVQVAGLVDLARSWPRLWALELPGRELVLAVRGLAVLAACAASVLMLRQRRRRGPGTPLRTVAVLRGVLLAVVVAVLAVTVTSAAGLVAAEPRLERQLFRGVLLLGLSVVACALVRTTPPGRARRMADLVTANVAVTLVAAELALVALAALWPTPLLWSGRSVESLIAAHKLAPGSRWFGKVVNRGGYADDAFFTAGPRDLVVAVLADSFGVGVVPHDRNFATLVERRLVAELGAAHERVAVQTYGISGIGLREHAYLLHTEVLPRNPQHVVLCVFVGNDIHDDPPFDARTTPSLEPRLQDWQLWKVAQRLCRLSTAPTEVAAAGAGGSDPPSASPAEEVPTFSPETFARIEHDRLRVCLRDDPDTDARFATFEAGLSRFAEWLDGRLSVVLIPDEFQVDDELWRELTRDHPDRARLDRDLPQRRLRARCAALGVPVVDCLPALRAAQPGGRTYHLRDTHWNVRGNRVAADVIAPHLLDALRRSGPRSR